MSLISEAFRCGLIKAIEESKTSLTKPWELLLAETDTFQDALDLYVAYYHSLETPAQKEEMSAIFCEQLAEQNFADEDVAHVRQFIAKILNDANIPALSVSWHTSATSATKTFAAGTTDKLSPKLVNTETLFPVASLSKPVSAAIVLDLIEQRKWDLDTPLAEIADYGPPELKRDPHYQKLTTRMVLGQCSGLPNWFYFNAEEKFIAEPGSEFKYSGIAFAFLKEVIEKTLGERWEALAQNFFAKVGMQNSTFKPLPASHLAGAREVAPPHNAEGASPIQAAEPMDSPEVPAGSLLTTANDYMIFLQYCLNNDYLKSTLLTAIEDFPYAPFAENQIKWGLGMGIFADAERTIAFHWGNNKEMESNAGADAFCAINMRTGDSVACFINSVNGPNVFQQLVNPVVGDMTFVFRWLATYCNFKAEKEPKDSDSIAALFPLVNSVAAKSLEQKPLEVSQLRCRL